MPQEALPPKVPLFFHSIIEFIDRITTQWRFAPMGGVVGLDYQSVIATASVFNFKIEALEMAVIQEYEKQTIEHFISKSK